MAKAKGLYKRGNIWWIRYAGLDGRIRCESSRSRSYKAAQDLLIHKKKEVMEGRDPMPVKRIKPHTLNELSERYLVWAERQRWFPRKRVVIKQLRKEFGNLPLRQFTTWLVEKYQNKMLTEGKAHATGNRHLAILKHMFTKAVEWEMVEEEALKKVRRVKLLPENNRRHRLLSKEECHALIDASSPHLQPIIITALNTGMRKEEILSLEWEKHVNLKNGFILLDVTKNGEGRDIPINKTLRETLNGVLRRIDSPYVFINEDGKRYLNVYNSFKSACRRAGIKDFRFHDLRHNFASHLVMSGVDLTTVKELLGHKTLTMTLRYAHLDKTHKAKAVKMLESALNDKSTIQKLYNLGGSQ